MTIFDNSVMYINTALKVNENAWFISQNVGSDLWGICGQKSWL